MKIRSKIVWIVLPLIIAPFILLGVAASLSARNGITKIATEFLRFKVDELYNYAASQWKVLEENNLTGKKEFIDATKAAVSSFAVTLVRSDTELIFAIDKSGKVVMSTGKLRLSEGETDDLLTIYSELSRESGRGAKEAQGKGGKTVPRWIQFSVAGSTRVGAALFFQPFKWVFLVTEKREAFYSAVNQIYLQSAVILGAATLISLILLIILSNFITNPIQSVVRAMRQIIEKNDLSRRVPVFYRDEIGELGHTFNIMTEELENAYNQIKSYAYRAVVARKREERIRNIFQRYVPKDVIDQFFANPESMLVGDNRELAVLFSDIRSFTTISEKLPPNQIVESLNHYFGMMVDIVMNHSGIVDKFIGDALMAFYGAPVRHDDDAERAVESGFDMLNALNEFNSWQRERNRPTFKIGIGINFGVVTVGNIGSEKKMDYTVIGDMVNLASRLQDLTKYYGEPIIISEPVMKEVRMKYPCRLLDRVAVVGKSEGVLIYTPKRELTQEEEKAWKLHHTGMKHYFEGRFKEALFFFSKVRDMIGDDSLAGLMIERCRDFMKNPPPEDWNGTMVMTHK